MSNEKRRQLAVLDQCVIAGFYALVSIAAIAFLIPILLPLARSDDFMATAWLCIFSAAVFLLMRLGVLVWEDSGDTTEDEHVR